MFGLVASEPGFPELLACRAELSTRLRVVATQLDQLVGDRSPEVGVRVAVRGGGCAVDDPDPSWTAAPACPRDGLPLLGIDGTRIEQSI